MLRKFTFYLLFIISALLMPISAEEFYRTIELEAGTLNTAFSKDERSVVTHLTITGFIDARDFKTMRDSMPLLAYIDLWNANIVEYTGNNGTYTHPEFEITHRANTIPVGAFRDLTKQGINNTLHTFIPPATTVEIASYAFMLCTELAIITIPEPVKKIGTNALAYCRKLSEIHLHSGFPIDLRLHYSLFLEVETSNCTLFVPYKSGNRYAKAHIWKDFANIVEHPEGFNSSAGMLYIDYKEGLSATISIDANVNWQLSADQPWLSLSKTSGSGNDQFIVSMNSQNDSLKARMGSVIISAEGHHPQSITIRQSGIPITITTTPGQLNNELLKHPFSILNNLALEGSMDVRDFKTLLSVLPELNRLDLSKVTIAELTGHYGSYFAQNELPLNAFFNVDAPHLKQNLVELTLPPDITSIGASAFEDCDGLTTLNIPGTVSIISQNAFKNCSSLTNITSNIVHPNFIIADNVFSGVNTDECIIHIPYATKPFYQEAKGWKDFKHFVEAEQGFLVSQRTLKFPRSPEPSTLSIAVDANVPWEASADLSWLSAINNDGTLTITAEPNPTHLPRNAKVTVSADQLKAQHISITQSGNALHTTAGGLGNLLSSNEKNYLTELALSGTIDYEDFRVLRQMERLAHVDLIDSEIVLYYMPLFGLTAAANSVPTSNYDINYRLQTIKLPAGATIIDQRAFSDCSLLYDVVFPPKLERIEWRAFYNCSSLTTIDLPATVNFIRGEAFSGCRNLTTIYAHAFTPPDMSVGGDGFGGLNKENITLFVPTGALHNYRNAKHWQDFHNIIELTTYVPEIKKDTVTVLHNSTAKALIINGISGEYLVSIYDLQGKIIFSEKIHDETSISTEPLQSGVYIVRIKTSTTVAPLQLKFLK